MPGQSAGLAAETAAMRAIERALNRLTPRVRRRVVTWVKETYVDPPEDDGDAQADE